MTKVLLLTIDALRYDVLKSEDVATPNISQLLEESIEFERVFSNGYGTSAAFPAILYSSTKNNQKEAPNQKSIADFFKDLDFQTIGISSNPNISPYFGYGREFDVFEDFVEHGLEKQDKSVIYRLGKKLLNHFPSLYEFITQYRAAHNIPYERASTINETVLQKLEPEKDQFFWVHYMETHAPYSPPEKYGQSRCPEAFPKRGKLTTKLYSEDLSSEEENQLKELYQAELEYLDEELGELLENFQDLDEDIYIVFTSDHGEGFGERGGCYQHSHPFEFNIHVPLAFKIPSENPDKEDKIASHLDILPTLLSQFDIETRAVSSGINLLEEDREYLTILTKSHDIIITDNWKLIESTDNTDSNNFLFPIKDNLEEEENYYEEKQETVERLQSLITRERNGLKGIDI